MKALPTNQFSASKYLVIEDKILRVYKANFGFPSGLTVLKREMEKGRAQ